MVQVVARYVTRKKSFLLANFSKCKASQLTIEHRMEFTFRFAKNILSRSLKLFLLRKIGLPTSGSYKPDRLWMIFSVTIRLRQPI